MPYQLDYRHILPRQTPTPTTTIVLPAGTSTGISGATSVVTGSLTLTDLGLSTATGDPAVRRVSSLFFYAEFG